MMDLAVLGSWLDSMILKACFILNNSMTLRVTEELWYGRSDDAYHSLYKSYPAPSKETGEKGSLSGHPAERERKEETYLCPAGLGGVFKFFRFCKSYVSECSHFAFFTLMRCLSVRETRTGQIPLWDVPVGKGRR